MFNRIWTVAAATVMLGLGGMASAQEIIVYRPAYVPPARQVYVPAPVVTYRPIGPTVQAYYAPAAAAPVAQTLYYAPAPAPVVAYQPVVSAAPAAVVPAVPVYVGRPVVVRTKVYVPGQPMRNFFRAITP